MSSMKDGVKKMIFTAIDTKNEMYLKFRQGGLDEEAALLASSIATKSGVEAMLEKNLANQDASTITNKLKSESQDGRVLN